MAAPFAAIEAATAASAVAALANVEATLIDDGVSVSVIFDNGFSDPLGIVSGTRPVMLAADADITTLVVGSTLTIGTTTYTVAELQPDGTGITRVVLK